EVDRVIVRRRLALLILGLRTGGIRHGRRSGWTRIRRARQREPSDEQQKCEQTDETTHQNLHTRDCNRNRTIRLRPCRFALAVSQALLPSTFPSGPYPRRFGEERDATEEVLMVHLLYLTLAALTVVRLAIPGPPDIRADDKPPQTRVLDYRLSGPYTHQN